MKQASEFKRRFLGIFGGVPKSDYDIVVEQRDDFIGDLKINDLQIKELEKENELLKKQIAHDLMTPAVIKTQNIKLKEIKRVASISFLPLEQAEFYLRNEILTEASTFIKVEYKPSCRAVVATLLLIEKDEEK